MRRTHVAACSAMENKLINIADVYEPNDEYDFTGPKNYDAMTGYRTQSMLVIPMEDDRGDGVFILPSLTARGSPNSYVPL